jgi:GNAT superfamily N-acetyltransferase
VPADAPASSPKEWANRQLELHGDPNTRKPGLYPAIPLGPLDEEAVEGWGRRIPDGYGRIGGVEVPAGAPRWAKVFTAGERPDLWSASQSEDRFRSLWPEYNHHGNHSGSYFGALFPRHAEVQVLLIDDQVGEVVARGRTLPFRWDGLLENLPRGIDAVGPRALQESAPPTSLCALAAEVLTEYQGRGLSGILVEAMAAVARRSGLRPLVAPVRPSRKDRYPLTPIDRYARWRREDGLPFDPWIRVHARLGGTVLRPEPMSLEITGPLEDWEKWVGMPFPEDGEYVFPGGLAPLSATRGIGSYWEPNVWILHDL